MKITKYKKSVAMFLSTTLALTSLPYSAVLAANYKASDKIWDFSDGTQGWDFDNSWSGESYTGGGSCAVDTERLKVSLDYSKNDTNGWSQAGISINDNIDYSPYKVLSFDFYYKSNASTKGDISIKPVSGDVEFKVESQACNLEQSDGEDIKKVSMAFEFDATKAPNQDKLMFLICGQTTDYKGDVWFDNIKLSANEQTTLSENKLWDFSDGTQDWTFDDSWAGDSYTGGGLCEADKEMLKVNLDYTKNTDNGWSQAGISFSDDNGIDFSPYKLLNFDLYYDTKAFTKGNITIKAEADGVFNNQMCDINKLASEAVDAGNGLMKVSMSFECDRTVALTKKPKKLMLLIVGNSTDYKGAIWFDNIELSATKPREEGLKDTTVKPETRTNITSTVNAVTVNGNSTNYTTSVKLVDSMADNKTISLYQYLKAIGESESTLFGHMEDTVLKAGSADLSYSDTEDATDSISAIVGLDCGELFRGFASKYNNRHEGSNLPDTNKGNIKAAALFSNEAIASGAIITISAHMPNFAFSEAQEGENTYDKFNFFAENSYNLKGDCMNNILPGGKYNDRFNAYLDMVAEYASQVDGAILFRPFHENTGSWFWWGKAFCDTETYKSVFKYTVEYLRDTKDIHNLIYVYGPGSEANSLSEYEERYPGDEYVDMVGFDTYDNNPAPTGETSVFEQNFETITRLVNEFAEKHGKLFAVTETGMSSETSGGIPKTGNKRPEWYSEILDIVTKPDYNCCYFMLWSNYSKDGGYYTPFVEEVNEDGTFFGHELLDAFITFYNNEKSIFAKDQLSVMNLVNSGGLVNATNEGFENVNGYITTPIAGSRILEETPLKANLSASDVQDVMFKILGNQEVSLNATVNEKQANAILDKDTLAKMGEVADGKIILYAGDKKLQEISVIFNIESRPDNPLLVDDFEVYGGVDALLGTSWAKNNDTGNTLNISLSQDFKYDGTYSMKFDYNETSTGWAGCTISKEADWSNCNAVQFYVKPDGNNQKTVIQINTSDGGSYEAYLQNYSEYANTTKPLLVTLPFNEFVDKGGKGALTSANAKSITGFGLWLNAISDSPAIKDGRVSGTLYYDAIQAVSTKNTEPIFQTLGGSEEPPVEDKELKEAINNANAVIDNPNSKVDDLLKAIANLSTAIIKHNK